MGFEGSLGGECSVYQYKIRVKRKFPESVPHLLHCEI